MLLSTGGSFSENFRIPLLSALWLYYRVQTLLSITGFFSPNFEKVSFSCAESLPFDHTSQPERVSALFAEPACIERTFNSSNLTQASEGAIRDRQRENRPSKIQSSTWVAQLNMGGTTFWPKVGTE